MTIKWDCEKKGCYCKTLPDWAMLDGCFAPTRVSLGDIDGIAHQNGRCAFFEKKFPNGDLLPPQIRAIDSLVAQGNSAFSIWCEDPLGKDIQRMRVWNVRGYDSGKVVPATLEDFRQAVKEWWASVYERGKV